MMAYDLSLEFHLPVGIEKVMRLLTEPELIAAWGGGDAKLELKEGGKFEMFDGWVAGNVLKCSETELAYTWKSSDWSEDTKPSEVYYSLTEENGATVVALEHKNFPSEEEMQKHETGWTEHFFGPMEDYILEHDF